MISESKLHIVPVNGKDIAELRIVQLLQEGTHTGKDLFEQTWSAKRHGRLHLK